jgi:hypothetical protein
MISDRDVWQAALLAGHPSRRPILHSAAAKRRLSGKSRG